MKKTKWQILIKTILIISVLFVFSPVKNVQAVGPTCSGGFSQVPPGVWFSYSPSTWYKAGAQQGNANGKIPYTGVEQFNWFCSTPVTSATFSCSGAFSGSGSASMPSGFAGPFTFASYPTSGNPITCTLTAVGPGGTTTMTDTLTITNAGCNPATQNQIIPTTFNHSTGMPNFPAGPLCSPCSAGTPDLRGVGPLGFVQAFCYPPGDRSFEGYDFCEASLLSCGPYEGDSFTRLDSTGLSYKSPTNGNAGGQAYFCAERPGGWFMSDFTATGSGWTWKCYSGNPGCPQSISVPCSATKLACSHAACADAGSRCSSESYIDDCGNSCTGTLTPSCGDPSTHCAGSYTGTCGASCTGTKAVAAPTSTTPNADKTSVTSGDSVTLSWDSTNASSCKLYKNGTLTDSLPATTKTKIVSPTTTTNPITVTYGVNCFNDCSVASGLKTVSVTVNPRTYSCTGLPANAVAWDAEESTGLVGADIKWKYSNSDTSTKCQFKCDTGYISNGDYTCSKGDLSALGCTINSELNPNANSCTTTLSWNVTNPAVVLGSGITSSTNDSGGTSANFPIISSTKLPSTGTFDIGTKTDVVIPYLIEGVNKARTFYLYNNGVKLAEATTTAIASCASGKRWDGNKCVSFTCSPLWGTTPINGGGSVVAAEAESVTYPALCKYETRVCEDQGTLLGKLSGSYMFEKCSSVLDPACSPIHYNCTTGATVTGSNLNSPTKWTWKCKGINAGPDVECFQKKSPGVIEN
ncbi:MAG: hypothetical protein WCW93_03260 [Candidatus Paceibacterota bacterium]